VKRDEGEKRGDKKASDMEYFINKTMEARARKEKKSC
jgi:hypothetical protein